MNCQEPIPIRAKKYCSRECAFEHRSNEKHHAWKGDKASYSAVHKWMTNNFGRPYKCFSCDGTTPRVEWANISGEYKREMSDWIGLCSSCHRYFDRNSERRMLILEKYTGQTAKLINEDTNGKT